MVLWDGGISGIDWAVDRGLKQEVTEEAEGENLKGLKKRHE